jgi:excisionase family DNA binding protein
MSWRDEFRRLMEKVPEAELPDLVAELARGDAIARRRLYAPQADAVTSPEPGGNGDALDRLLTVEEAAERLGVRPRWLYENADRLRFTRRIGRRTLRFSEKGLEQYMATRR